MDVKSSSDASIDIDSEVLLSRLYHKDNDNVILSRWKMNLITIIHKPYLWLCVAVNDKIFIYKLSITPSKELLSKYNSNPIGYCIIKSTINHIDSLQHETNPLLFSCSENGKISIFDCKEIVNRVSDMKIYKNTQLKYCLHFLPTFIIDNTEFMPNTPSNITFTDYSVWSMDVKHCISSLNNKNKDKKDNKMNSFLIGFGSNTHYFRQFKIDNDYESGKWYIESMSHGLHKNNVPDIALSVDNQYIATVSIDGSLRIWKNDYIVNNKHDQNDNISRIVLDEKKPVIQYNQFGWLRIKSSPWLWSVMWIDPESIAFEQSVRKETKQSSNPKSNKKRIHQIGNKFSSLRHRLKFGKTGNGKNKEKDKDNESPYIEVFNFDPSDDDDCNEQKNESKYELKEEEETKENVVIDNYMMIVCSESSLYVLKMIVMDDDSYKIKNEISINNIYDELLRLNEIYLNMSHVGRLQHLRYIPELSMIICASCAFPCCAILQLYQDTESKKMNYIHHGFYPRNWAELNTHCKNCLFLAGLEIVPIKNTVNNQVEAYRIVLLYHSGLISVINVQCKNRNCCDDDIEYHLIL